VGHVARMGSIEYEDLVTNTKLKMWSGAGGLFRNWALKIGLESWINLIWLRRGRGGKLLRMR
jgi:hypothetical protein